MIKKKGGVGGGGGRGMCMHILAFYVSALKVFTPVFVTPKICDVYIHHRNNFAVEGQPIIIHEIVNF